MAKKEYTSFYEVCKEILIETNSEKDEVQFDNYYKEQKKRFKEILNRLGVNPDSLKEQDTFKIPLQHKDIVKDWLNNYTSKPTKQLRKSQYFDMEIHDLKDIVQQTNELLESLPSYQKYNERSKMYFATRFIVREAIEEVQSLSLSQVISDIEEMKLYFTEAHYLNDSDKAHLLRFYGQLIQETSQKWRSIVSIFEDIRQAEIAEISSQELEENNPELSSYDQNEDLQLNIDSPYVVLWEAINSFYEDAIDMKKRISLDSSELDRIGDIINQIKNKS